jgi:hypothetical protein
MTVSLAFRDLWTKGIPYSGKVREIIPRKRDGLADPNQSSLKAVKKHESEKWVRNNGRRGQLPHYGT